MRLPTAEQIADAFGEIWEILTALEDGVTIPVHDDLGNVVRRRRTPSMYRLLDLAAARRSFGLRSARFDGAGGHSSGRPHADVVGDYVSGGPGTSALDRQVEVVWEGLARTLEDLRAARAALVAFAS